MKSALKKRYWLVFAIILTVFVYRNWFSKQYLVAGDFPYVPPLALGDLRGLPFAWNDMFGSGFGGRATYVLNLDTYLRLGVSLLVFMFRVSWNIAYRMLFFWPFLFIGSAASYAMVGSFVKRSHLAAVGLLLYLTNSYILMLAGGGQVGLMMAYAIAPLVVLSLRRDRPWWFGTGVFFLLLFDFRFSLLVCFLVIAYAAWFKKNLLRFVLPTLLAFGLSAFWAIPAVFFRGLALPDGLGSSGWLSFLSWAEFSKTVSLLHPNWPENIFGKTYFFRPEFLIIPIVAFVPLMLGKALDKDTRRVSYFWTIVAIISAFFAKGTNPPFGEVNRWVFTSVPLFDGFRDPTKFYLLIALSYAVLIPVAIESLVTARNVRRIGVLIGIFVMYWVYLLSPHLLAPSLGTFSRSTVPVTYDAFALTAFDSGPFGRTLAVPWRSRYLFNVQDHPIVDARDALGTTDIGAIAGLVGDPGFASKLQRWSVRFVVVPDDVAGEVFLTDRKYDAEKKRQIVEALDALPYLTKRKGFGNLIVYEYQKQVGKFSTVLPNTDRVTFVSHKASPVRYYVDVDIADRPIDIFFSAAYDPGWVLSGGGDTVRPERTPDGLMKFTLRENVSGNVTVSYLSQSWVDRGYIIAATVLLFIAVFAAYRTLPRKLALACILVPTVIVGLRTCIVAIPSDREIGTDSHIVRTNEWLATGEDGMPSWVSHYGGAAMGFRVKGTDRLSFIVRSPNNDPGIQGLDISVGDRVYTVETPLYNTVFSVPVGSLDPEKTYDVRIRHWCAATYHVCDIAVSDMRAARSATILGPASPRKKTMAVLGDSISVSFGSLNYVYRLADDLGYELHNASIFGSSIIKTDGLDWAGGRYPTDITDYKPDVLFISIGTNDMLHDPDAFRTQYRAMITDIQQKSPDTRIIVSGLLKRADFSRQRVTALSAIIRSVAAERGIGYVDPYDFLDVNDLQDVVHPASTSQVKLARAYYETLRHLVGE